MSAENTKIAAAERGNVLFIILLAVALIGLLTAAISGGSSDNKNIDNETLILKTSEIQRYAKELERAVQIIMQNGASESDLRFAHAQAHSDYGTISTTPDKQVFAPQGGAATYRTPPEEITTSSWEFAATTAIPGIGTSRADLVAVLPDVSLQFCQRVNELNGQSAIPDDTGVCLYVGDASRFDDGTFATSPNTMDETSFEQDANITAARPAPQACVLCASDANYYFYQVLLAR